MQHIRLLVILTLIFSASCKLVRKDDERNPVARVYERYLYEEDISGLTHGMDKEDSAVFIDNYIYNWGKEQLLIYRAEYNLREDQKEFDELVTQYRNDLLKFAYIEKYVGEHIDTALSEAEILDYYNEHKADFELKENILKAEYYVVNQNVPDLKKAKYWWNTPSEKNTERFVEFASIFASSKSVGDTSWVRYMDLANKVPLQTYNQESVLRNKRVLIEDTSNVYFVAINAYKIKDDVSPLPYVRETIKSILINKRKLDIITKMEESLVSDAYDKKDFEIFE